MKPDPKKNPVTSARVVPAKAVRTKADEIEPSMQRGHVPIAFFAILALLLFGAFVFLDERAGGFNPQVYGAYESYNQIKKLQPATGGLAEGERVYTSVCLPCHQANGLGAVGQFPPLAGSEWVISEAPDRIARIVMHGLQGQITVKGASYNNAMPGFGENLSDKEIAAVLTYIRKTWGNAASDVTTEKVTEIRDATKGRNQQWTVGELQGIPGAP